MVVFRLVLKHRLLFISQKTSFKMALTLSQKLLTIFCQKVPNFVYFEPFDFVKISPACGPKTYQFRIVGISNSNIKCPIGKWIFVINLELKIFRAIVANAIIWSLKALPTLFDTRLDHMLVKFEQNRIVKNIQNFEFFERKPGF